MMQTSQRHTPYSTSLQTFQRSSSYNGFSELLTTSPSSVGSYNSYYNPTSFYSTSYPPQQSTTAALLGAGNSYYYQQQQPATTSCTTTSYVTDSPNESASSPLPSPQSPPQPYSPQMGTSDTLPSSSVGYTSPNSVSPVYKSNYPLGSFMCNNSVLPQNGYLTPSSSSTSSAASSTSSLSFPFSSTNLSDPPNYSNGFGGTQFNYLNNYSSASSSNSGYYTPSSSTLYPLQDYSHYPSSAVGLTTTSSFALWNYPSLPVGPKVSYDTPRYKLTPERAIPLLKWFDDHKEHPYPSRHEKMLLCQATQLTFTQVSTWFANARRRLKKAAQEDDENEADDESDTTEEQ